MNEWRLPDSSLYMHSAAITAAKVHTYETIPEEFTKASTASKPHFLLEGLLHSFDS